MKGLLENLWLVLGSTVLALAIGELLLRMDGRFTYLTSQTYVRSPAIWERPSNKTETHRQPDLHKPVEIHFDADGVRNHTRLPTSEKHNVIGVFGDSFVENRRVEDRFSFTTVLDEAAQPSARVVNFGVDGYGLDQEYLRYKKFESQDIRHVVYVFCGNDLSNLYETGLVSCHRS